MEDISANSYPCLSRVGALLVHWEETLKGVWGGGGLVLFWDLFLLREGFLKILGEFKCGCDVDVEIGIYTVYMDYFHVSRLVVTISLLLLIIISLFSETVVRGRVFLFKRA